MNESPFRPLRYNGFLLVLMLICFSVSSKAAGAIRMEQGTCSIYDPGTNILFASFPVIGHVEVTTAKERVRYRMGSFQFKDKEIRKWTYLSHQIHQNLDPAIQIEYLFTQGTDTIHPMISYTVVDGRCHFHFESRGAPINRITLRFGSVGDELFYGLGEQYSHWNLKGHRVPVFSEEQGIGRGDPPSGLTSMLGIAGHEFSTYAAVPWFISTKGRGMLVDTYAYSEFDFRADEHIAITIWKDEFKGSIFTSERPLDLISKLTGITGRMPELPEWAFGTWLGVQGGREHVLQYVDMATDAGVPVTALWIQDWVGKRKTSFGSRLWWNWVADEIAYPDFKQFCDSLEDQDIKVLGYINSFLADGTEMFETARKNDFLVKDVDGNDYKIRAGGFPAYLVDLSDPRAVKWLKDIIRSNMIEIGLDGWMADFTEWLPYDAVVSSGISAKEYHHKYIEDWVRLHREVLEEEDKLGEIVFFNRAGYTRSPQYSTMFWSGDQLTNYSRHDGLRSAIMAMNTGGVSGISINHSDIGGYTNIRLPFRKILRNRDLFYRWAEMNAFTPIFRTHEGLMPDRNVQFYSDTASLAFFARMAKVHAVLGPYFQQLNREAASKGYPMIRHPYLHYPQDTVCQRLEYQFMLGEEIMVAPVVAPDQEEVTCYLPEGEWVHVWTEKTFAGGKYCTVSTPYGYPGVFAKAETGMASLFTGFSDLQNAN